MVVQLIKLTHDQLRFTLDELQYNELTLLWSYLTQVPSPPPLKMTSSSLQSRFGEGWSNFVDH